MTADGAQAGASAAFRAYLEEIGRNLTAGNATEHTHRPALQQLVQALDPQVRAVNEPKRVECGAPDYIVTRNDLPVGYIEAKDVGRSLDEIERDEQLKRYRGSLSNLILTDYLEFRWYKDGEKQQTARLAFVGDSGVLRPDREGQTQAATMFSSFLAQEPPIVGKPEDLARRMAALTRIIRDIVDEALVHDRGGGSPLREQLDAFRRVLIHDLGEEQFADMYTQTIAYGLFAARVNAPAAEHFTRQHAAYDLPKTNPFLRQMFGQIAGPELDERITWAVDDLAELLARARMDRVLEDFGKRTRQEDPVVHFYETFLAAYDPKMREARGVYYTPEPVVSYIVRSIDHILKTEFGLSDGLADNSMIEVPVPGKPKETRKVHKVQILDPACGTGTFLAQVIETIRDTVVAKHGAGMWPGYVHNHLLPRLYGFELLMAPYAIAHLKLGLRLKETGYDIEQSERLRVYLTNSLEEAHDLVHGQQSLFSTWLAEEADRASEVKRELPIMVILGNPPYSGESANRGEWITSLLHGEGSPGSVTSSNYFEVDGEPLGEKTSKWLNNDYVRFLRFAQWRIETTGYGVVGMITDNGYLDSPTFRGMRQCLARAYDSISVLNLHGNSNKRERSPDGTPDHNVFDIQQGVAIALLTKGQSRSPRVHYSDLWGTRESKYSALLSSDVGSTEWAALQPSSPEHLFVPQDESLRGEYERGWYLKDVMPLHGPGMTTARDAFVIDFSDAPLVERAQTFMDPKLGDADVQARLGIAEKKGWDMSQARRLLRDETRPLSEIIRPVLYRPFDERRILYHSSVVWRTVQPVMLPMMARANIGLIATRQTRDQWDVFVTKCAMTHKSMAAYDINTLFPLYNAPAAVDALRLEETDGASGVNLAKGFLEAASGIGGDHGPKDVFCYIYGCLRSPTYRSRYGAFLTRDFPRIPLTSNSDLFRELSRLGSRLVALHLMQADDLAPGPRYEGLGQDRVETVRYSEPGQGSEQGRVWINATQYFEGVPPEVWEFHIGGYQVCAKWLKDRKGRSLAYEDLTHYQRVVAALAETIALMRETDEVIEAHGGWPLN
jgi:predicted helicase